MKVIITDATPLILLAKVALLDLLCDQFTVITTSEVAIEATRRQDLVDAQYIQQLLDKKRITTKPVNQKDILVFQKKWGVGKGEASVLLLASEEKAVVVTDDFSAMRIARMLHIPFVTSLLLIIEMKNRGLLSLDLALSKLVALEEHAWLSSEIFADARKLLEQGGK